MRCAKTKGFIKPLALRAVIWLQLQADALYGMR
jgi:hypothetical protein